jgi:hypothetical protein
VRWISFAQKMPAENDANLANYSELRAHVDLSKKILEAEKPDTDEYRETMNDLSMYYERIVQLKMMRIQTLQEQYEETETAHRATTKVALANKRAFKWLLRASFVCLAMAGIWMWPSVGFTAYDFVHPYVTCDRIGAIVILVVWMNRHMFQKAKLKKD